MLSINPRFFPTTAIKIMLGGGTNTGTYKVLCLDVCGIFLPLQIQSSNKINIERKSIHRERRENPPTKQRKPLLADI